MAGGLTGAEAHPVAGAAVASGATLLGLATEQWLTIAFGLVIGVVARWALLLTSAREIGRRTIRIDAMMFAANGVLAAQAADAMGLSGVRLLTAAMMFGAASTMLFSRLHEKWLRRAEALDLPAPPPAFPPDTAAKVVHTPGPETKVFVEAVAPDVTPRRLAGRALRRAIPPPVGLSDEDRYFADRITAADRQAMRAPAEPSDDDTGE